MKNLNKYIAVFLVLVTFTACEDFLGGDINADPNNPVSVPVTAQFPAFQIALADVYGGAFSRFNCMLTQQVEGVARQWSSFNQYTGLTPNRFDTPWTNIYENVLNEIVNARVNANEGNLNHHSGMLDIMEAYTLMISTDVWDDMPYSAALKGFEDINPAYDSQASIYTALMGLLDSGISKLNGAAGAAAVGGEDVYYGGDVAKWILAANGIKARGLLHQGDYSGAMAAANASFASAGDNLAFQYPNANAAGGWYRFNRDRTGDLEFHPHMRGLMESLTDTMRLNAFDQIFTTDHTYLVPDYLLELISYRETQFIVAECAVRNGDGAAAHAAMVNGVNASFARALGAGTEAEAAAAEAAAAAYLADNDPGMGNVTLEDVMTQKYIGMFLQPEVYSDYRRTNIPNLSPVAGSNVPVRWDYPADEYLFNSSAPADGSVNFYTDKVGWNR